MRKRTKPEPPPPPPGLTKEAAKAINSIHPERFEFYKGTNLAALDSYVRGWLGRATRHKVKIDLPKHPSWVAHQVRAWVNKKRPYRYNGYWEKQEAELPRSKKQESTAPALQKKPRRRRRTAA